jgi:hypothetical protein
MYMRLISQLRRSAEGESKNLSGSFRVRTDLGGSKGSGLHLQLASRYMRMIGEMRLSRYSRDAHAGERR